MDTITIIIVSLIVSAFVLFAVVLVYGDYATQQVRHAAETKSVDAGSAPVQHRDAA